MSPDSQAYKDAWARVRAAIKMELMDVNTDYPRWSDGWLTPGSDESADSMLDDIACMATRAAFGIEDQIKEH